MADDRTLEKKLDAILDALSEKDPHAMGGTFGNKAKDLTNSKEFKTLGELVEEKHDLLQEDTDQLKGDAQANKLANKLQIGKEILDLSREAKAGKFYDKQKKHNKGARIARIKIIKQNDETKARNEDIIKLIKEFKKTGVPGGQAQLPGPTKG